MSDKNKAPTVEEQKAFCDLLRKGNGVGMASRALGFERQTMMKLAKREAEFAEQVLDAKRDMVEVLEQTAFNRATLSDKSDSLLLALLRAHKPELYRERSGLEVSNPDGSLSMSDTEKLARIEALRLAAKKRKDGCADLF